MAGMSSLVRIVNAGVPGSQDRVDVVLRDGVVASVGLLERSRLRTARCRLRRIRHRWNTRRMPLLLAASQSQRRPPHPPTKPPSTRRPVGYSRPVGLPHALHAMAKTLGRLDSSMPVPPPKRWTCCAVIWSERRAADTLDPDAFVVGMRFRHSLWADDEQPTLAAIDAVTGEQPVALSSADMHCGWVNSAAARRLGVHVTNPVWSVNSNGSTPTPPSTSAGRC